MFLYQWCEERRSLRCPSENKQASESKIDTKNQNSIPICYQGVLTQAERKKTEAFYASAIEGLLEKKCASPQKIATKPVTFLAC